MTENAHVEALAEKHASLEQTILNEVKRPNPDYLRLSELKRQKLKIKEELSRLSAHSH